MAASVSFKLHYSSDAELMSSNAVRGHSFCLCNSGATGWTWVSYVGWAAIGWLQITAAACVGVCVCVRAGGQQRGDASPAQFCSCLVQFVSGEVGPSLSQQQHHVSVPVGQKGEK